MPGAFWVNFRASRGRCKRRPSKGTCLQRAAGSARLLRRSEAVHSVGLTWQQGKLDNGEVLLSAQVDVSHCDLSTAQLQP